MQLCDRAACAGVRLPSRFLHAAAPPCGPLCRATAASILRGRRQRRLGGSGVTATTAGAGPLRGRGRRRVGACSAVWHPGRRPARARDPGERRQRGACRCGQPQWTASRSCTRRLGGTVSTAFAPNRLLTEVSLNKAEHTEMRLPQDTGALLVHAQEFQALVVFAVGISLELGQSLGIGVARCWGVRDASALKLLL